jgi:hypothetical protein
MGKLIDIDKGGRVISAEKMENIELMTGFKRDLNPRTFNKVVRIIDESIDTIKNNAGTIKLTWGCVGSLFGTYSNVLKHGDVEYLWNTIISKMGDDRLCKMTLGCLLMWRVANRAESTEEDWIATRTEYEDFDTDTGKRIARYEYFIAK